MALVIAGYDPHPVGIFDPDLGRSEDVAGRVQRHGGGTERHPYAVFCGRQFPVSSKPQLCDWHTGTCENIPGTPMAQMICVSMGDDGVLDWLPGIDVKIARRAIEPIRGDDNKLLGI